MTAVDAAPSTSREDPAKRRINPSISISVCVSIKVFYCLSIFYSKNRRQTGQTGEAESAPDGPGSFI